MNVTSTYSRGALELSVQLGERLAHLCGCPDRPHRVVLVDLGNAEHRHDRVAQALNRGGFATLLFDLLTPEEERDRANVFDVDLLAGRLIGATR